MVDGDVDGDVLCPSAQPDQPGARVFGVVEGTADTPRVRYLYRTLPVLDDVLALASPVTPTEVFPFAAPCALDACQHFEAGACSLAAKISRLQSGEGLGVPACRIRHQCRWWRQEGKAACHACPNVITLDYRPPAQLRLAADPATR